MSDSSIGYVAILAVASASFAGFGGACRGGDGAAEGIVDSGSDPVDAGNSPDAEAPPGTSKAAGLAYHDSDFRKGFLGNEVVIKKAAKESDILEYRVYFGSSPEEKLVGSPLGVTPARGVDVSVPVPKDTRLPDGATHLLVYTVGAKGESPSPVATPLRDNILESRVLAADGGKPAPALRAPSIALDAKNKRVIFGGTSDALALQLVVCNDALDTCTHRDASLGIEKTAYTSALFVDTVADKIAAVTSDLSAGGTSGATKLRYTSCALDGTACVASDISGGKSNYYNIDVTVDAASQRLYIASIDYYYQKSLSLMRCRLDGTDCSSKILWPTSAGFVPNIMLDPAAKRLLVTTTDSGDYKLHLFRCDLEGDGCSMTNAEAKRPDHSGFAPRSVLDNGSGQVLTITRNEVHKPSLFRCDAKTAQCIHHDIAPDQPERSYDDRASLALYAETASFFFLTGEPGTQHLSLFHCKTDGTQCSRTLLSEEAGYGQAHSLIVDRANDRVIVVAPQDDSAGARTSLFTFRPW